MTVPIWQQKFAQKLATKIIINIRKGISNDK